ncbi:biotin transporter BioY [Occallatibacter savannae]|uniref:biotin transporter BioY n=1 Tax=Occallatibacter savannae TaxID=1002691 RepID=UPI00194DF5C1|nr:biotin transporter BioY [Occallatibacter savannae]
MENRLPIVSETAHSAAATGLRTAGVILGGSAFVAVCSHISIPLWFTPVPLTLQPFAVLLVGLMLSPRVAAATLGAYLLEGAAGLPVFAPGFTLGAGMAHLLGPTGGYLMSYPAAAALVSWMRSNVGRGFGGAALSAASGNAVILLCGFAWLARWTHAAAGPAFALAVLPFLPGDALKVVAAAGIARGWDRIRRDRYTYP